MKDGQRIYPVNKLIMHHAVSDLMFDWDDLAVQDWFSNIGKSRGYSNGAVNPYHEHPGRPGQLTYSMAHFCLHPYTKDGNKYGWRLVELIKYPWDNVAWHAGNWAVNQTSIGVETAGNYVGTPVDEKALMLVADYFRSHDRSLGGSGMEVYPHQAFYATQCPGQIAGQIGTLIDMINNPDAWNAKLWPAPVVVEPPKPVENPYSRFETPLQLIANKQPTNAYDLSQTTWEGLKSNIVKTLNQGDEFIAVGKYKHPLGGVYFMTEYSFGEADKTGVPSHPYGINTVDLSPKPVEEVKPKEPKEDDGAVEIPVTVIPPDPNKWMQSYVDDPDTYIANQTVTITDFSGQLPNVVLTISQIVEVAGTFEKDGATYYRTKKSKDNGSWYGIPEDALSEDDSVFVVDDFTKLSFKEKVLKFFATVVSYIKSIGKKKEVK